MSSLSAFLSQCASHVGGAHLITSADQIRPYCAEKRGEYHTQAAAIVLPGNVSEVAAVMTCAQAHQIVLIAQGGNTGLVGGQVPSKEVTRPQVILSTRRLNRCRAISDWPSSATVESGVTLRDVCQFANENGYFFPLSLPSEAECTVGGNIATNAGGLHALAYGTMRALTLGIEVVLADGRILSELDALPKDNTGYRLTPLFIGSEGSLGIITAAQIKLFPKIKTYTTALIALKDLAKGIEFYRLCYEYFSPQLHVFELISDRAIDYVLRHQNRLAHTEGAPPFDIKSLDPSVVSAPWHIMIELATEEERNLSPLLADFLNTMEKKSIISHYRIGASLTERTRMWRLRESISQAQTYEGASIKNDISIPLDQLAAFFLQAEAMILNHIPGARIVAFGHMGDGNIHYNISQPLDMNREDFLSHREELQRMLYALVCDYGGSIAAEHGIGQMKATLLERTKDPVLFEVMQRLKNTFDPHNILNPAKIFPLAPNPSRE